MQGTFFNAMQARKKNMYKPLARTKLWPFHRRELQKTIPLTKCFFFFFLLLQEVKQQQRHLKDLAKLPSG